MDFIERIFHVAPDGSSGLLEMAILLVVLMAPFGVVVFRKNGARLLLSLRGLCLGQRRQPFLGPDQSQRS
ncbi:MAG TPA: hypothetical protein VMI06_15790 [Terriglobia bacterium]|nr:hypothetical protein [Terriglobia bacterium]